MEAIILEATQTTPNVALDPVANKFEITGESRPENAAKFYAPIISWLDNYCSVLFFQQNNFGKTKKIIFTFKFEYFNSTSAKFILDIFYMLEKIKKQGSEVEIIWNYDKRDTDMKEAGEEFSKYVPELSITYSEY